MIGDVIGAVLMVGSLFVDPPFRYWIWAAAVAVLMIAPAFAVRAYEGQPFDSRHIPERYGLFTIIVLGEGVVAVTAGLSDVSLDGGSVASALLGFGIAAAIWYAYFETVSSSALSRERVGASFLWGYGHLFAFAGIAAAAVGVELAIEAGAHGDHGLSLATRLMVCAGPAAFLLALAAIHKTTIRAWDTVMTQRMGAIAVLLGVAGFGRGLAPALLVGIVFVVLTVTVAFDVVRAGGKGLAAEDAPGDETHVPGPV
jgi:low temperature requirement protein LtrA